MANNRKLPNDKTLTKLYKNQKLRLIDIAKRYNCSPEAVFIHIKRLGLTRRTQIGQSGKDHPQWKGGRGIKSGYWTVYIKKHPRRLNNGRVYEHIIVAEKKYGREIKKGEPIHHIDFDRLNNKPENLYLCKDNKEHMDLHYSLEEVARDLFRSGKLGFNNGKYYWKQ